MSVFTFMDDGGLLKKDNDLTLSVVEEALNAYYTSIMTSEKTDTKAAKFKICQKLLEVLKNIVHEFTLDELIGEFEPEVQLIVTINYLDYAIKLSADHQSAVDRLKTSNSNDLIVFDRDSRPVQKLRYFRL
uniref:Phage protein n=1 Tax=Panagrolaimus sp. ES5 TaxID=591445 RepID=A0AC34FWU1_9BILA